MSYKKSNWVPYDPTLSFEQNVTQGGTTTADKLNNMETGISNAFDKTSDTIGGRNMATNPDDVLITPVDNAIGWSSTLIGAVTPEFFKITNKKTTQPITISFEINTPDDPTKTSIFDRIRLDGGSWGADAVIGIDYFSFLGFKWLEIGNNVWKGTYTLQFDQSLDTVDSSKPNINLLQTKPNMTSHNFTVLGNSLCLYWGTQATDWTPAPEDKVNVSDMRKPASDVAGIEEVNAKQDKIGYTPADDSKVVHTADTSNWQKNKVTNDDGTPFVNLTGSSQDLSATLMSLSTGFHTVYANGAVVNNPFNGMSSAKGVIDIQRNNTGSSAFGEGFLIGCPNQVISMYHVWLDGIKAYYTQIANDSKVAHLSGANNFDTVPTVNNKSVATTNDVATASNTVLTSANTSISKLLQSSSNNDADSAVTNSTSDTSNFYYWTE
jgi:hypothetical protein